MASQRLSSLVSALLSLLVLLPFPASAQTPAAAPAVAASEQSLKAGELDALVAPIALYPDPLVSLVLMASTYPLEVVQADRWVRENQKFKGDQLKAEVAKQAWDESIKSLVATPDVLSMMSAKLDWTLKLGNAVLAQQSDVMDAIQRLRTKADANKKLTSTKEQTVSRRQEQGKEVIVIEPTTPETIHVPYYDPAVVYGEWPYAEYAPYSFPWPGYIASGLIATGIAFGASYALGRWASGGNYWGGGCNWGNNNININRPRVNPLGGNNWQHNPGHRKGVRYNNPHVSARFGDNSLRGGSQNRMDFRGRDGNQVIKPGGGDRPGAGQRPGGGDRPGAGQRPGGGDRPGAGQRPGGGDRPGAGQRPGGATTERRTTTKRGATTERRSTAFGRTPRCRTAAFRSTWRRQCPRKHRVRSSCPHAVRPRAREPRRSWRRWFPRWRRRRFSRWRRWWLPRWRWWRFPRRWRGSRRWRATIRYHAKA